VRHYTREELNSEGIGSLRSVLNGLGIHSNQGANAIKPEAQKAAKRWLVRNILKAQDQHCPDGYRGLARPCPVCGEAPGVSLHKCCACGHRADGFKAILNDFGFRPVAAGLKSPQGTCRQCRRNAARVSVTPAEDRLRDIRAENARLRERVAALEQTA
jgi:hypothetical protein